MVMWTWTLQLERDDSRHTSQWVKLVSVDVIKLGAHNDAHFIAFLVSYPSSSFSTEKVPLGKDMYCMPNFFSQVTSAASLP